MARLFLFSDERSHLLGKSSRRALADQTLYVYIDRKSR
jgi:hypothetical protein